MTQSAWLSIIIPVLNELGLKHFSPALFRGIRWSTDTVFADTLARMESLQWKVTVMPTLNDIDEPADLHWLPPELRPVPAEPGSMEAD